MKAYKISINGKYFSTVSHENWNVLTVTLVGTCSEKNGEQFNLNAGGLLKQNSEGISQHFRYKTLSLKENDKVEVELVDTDAIDPPQKKYRSDHEIQESPFTEEEEKEMRYKEYLELKKEFESDNT